MNIPDTEQLLAAKMLSEHGLVNYPEKETVLSVLKEVCNLSQSELAEKDKRIEELENNLKDADKCSEDLAREVLQLETQLTEANKEIERLQNIGIGFCSEIERLKGLIYTAFTTMPNDPFQTKQEAWEQFKAENNL